MFHYFDQFVVLHFWFVFILTSSFTFLVCACVNLFLHTFDLYFHQFTHFGLCFGLFIPCFHLVLVSIYFILDTLFFMEVSRTFEASPLFIFIGWGVCKEHQNQAWLSHWHMLRYVILIPFGFFVLGCLCEEEKEMDK